MLSNQICKLRDEISSKGVAIGLGKLPLLNDEMDYSTHRPTDTAEFCAKIPGSIRECTDSAQAHKYIRCSIFFANLTNWTHWMGQQLLLVPTNTGSLISKVTTEQRDEAQQGDLFIWLRNV